MSFSKPKYDNDDQELTNEQKKKQAKYLLYHIMFNVTTLTFPIQAGPQVATLAYNNDFAEAAKFIGMCSSATAAVGFLFEPTVGVWLDENGRRKGLLLGPFLNAIFSAMYCFAPHSLTSVFLIRSIGNSLNAVSGSTSTIAALSDVCSGDELSKNLALFGGYAGLGVVLGPMFGNLFLAYGGPGLCYAVRALFSLWHWNWLRKNIKETLPKSKRKKSITNGNIPWQSPFNFYKLFTTDKTLTKLSLYNSFNIMCEGKNINDLNQLWMKAELGMSIAQTAYWTIGFGVAMFVGGNLAKTLFLPRLGGRGFTTFTNTTNLLAYLSMGSFKSNLMYWLSLLLLMPGINGVAGSAMKSLATQKAKQLGFGGGEYSGLYSNLRSLLYVIGPLVYTRFYAYNVQSKLWSGRAYYAVATLGALIPLVIHSLMTNKELYGSDEGEEKRRRK